MLTARSLEARLSGYRCLSSSPLSDVHDCARLGASRSVGCCTPDGGIPDAWSHDLHHAWGGCRAGLGEEAANPILLVTGPPSSNAWQPAEGPKLIGAVGRVELSSPSIGVVPSTHVKGSVSWGWIFDGSLAWAVDRYGHGTGHPAAMRQLPAPKHEQAHLRPCSEAQASASSVQWPSRSAPAGQWGLGREVGNQFMLRPSCGASSQVGTSVIYGNISNNTVGDSFPEQHSLRPFSVILSALDSPPFAQIIPPLFLPSTHHHLELLNPLLRPFRFSTSSSSPPPPKALSHSNGLTLPRWLAIPAPLVTPSYSLFLSLPPSLSRPVIPAVETSRCTAIAPSQLRSSTKPSNPL
jgi:hypothetical protein